MRWASMDAADTAAWQSGHATDRLTHRTWWERLASTPQWGHGRLTPAHSPAPPPIAVRVERCSVGLACALLRAKDEDARAKGAGWALLLVPPVGVTARGVTGRFAACGWLDAVRDALRGAAPTGCEATGAAGCLRGAKRLMPPGRPLDILATSTRGGYFGPSATEHGSQEVERAQARAVGSKQEFTLSVAFGYTNRVLREQRATQRHCNTTTHQEMHVTPSSSRCTRASRA